MSENESEFDALVNLHTEIKTFKIDKSEEILNKFHSKNKPKFKLTAEEKESEKEEEQGVPSRLSLSSTTVCAYALSQYQELWKENGKPQYVDSRFNLWRYYESVITGLYMYLDKQSDKISKLESPDEFSLLNMLPLLKKIQGAIKKENDYSK